MAPYLELKLFLLSLKWSNSAAQSFKDFKVPIILTSLRSTCKDQELPSLHSVQAFHQDLSVFYLSGITSGLSKVSPDLNILQPKSPTPPPYCLCFSNIGSVSGLFCLFLYLYLSFVKCPSPACPSLSDPGFGHFIVLPEVNHCQCFRSLFLWGLFPHVLLVSFLLEILKAEFEFCSFSLVLSLDSTSVTHMKWAPLCERVST